MFGFFPLLLWCLTYYSLISKSCRYELEKVCFRWIIFIFILHFLSVSTISLDEYNSFKWSLNEASYTNDGKISEFEYHCDSSLLEECRNKLRVFLRANDYPYSFFTMGGSHISLYLHEKLSDAQINKFEEEFNLNLKGFSISCNSNRIEYEFT